MNGFFRALGSTLCFAGLAFAQSSPSPLEQRARKLEAELGAFGYTFAAPIEFQVLPAGEYAAAGQREVELLHGPMWVESQTYLRQAFGLDTGKSTAEARVKLTNAVMNGFPLFYASEQRKLVVDASREADVTDQELVRAMIMSWRDRAAGLNGVYGGDRRTIESIVIGRALLAGEGELAALALKETKAQRDLRTLHIGSLDSPLPKGVGDDLTRVVHRLGRDLLLHRFQSSDWKGVRVAYDERPASSEQLAHANKLYRDIPRALPLPVWDASLEVKVERVDQMGELALFTLLLDMGIPLADAQLAAIGWDGDELQYLHAKDGSPAMVWRIYFDRHEDVKQFVTLITNRVLGQVLVRGTSVDWVRSDAVALGFQLTAAMEASKLKLTPNPEDRESTVALEASLDGVADLTPRIELGRWVHPRFALSVPAPEGWKTESVQGQAFLMGPQIDTFKDNVSVLSLDAGRGITLDELLVQQRKQISEMVGVTLEIAEKRTVDNREVVYLRYAGFVENNDLVFNSIVYLYEGRPVVVSMTVARANLERMEPVIAATLGGLRFQAVRAGRPDSSR